VHEREASFGMEQRTRANPVEQLVAIARLQDVLERVAATRRLEPFGDAQKVKVVIAEHDERRVPERLDEAQALERRRAAVHEIADEPQLVARRIERDRIDEPLQGPEAALQIADGVRRQVYLAALTM
jgi:hypothetical protein